ncbi:MAG: nicotinamide mononucleotide transporter [Clostridia bacterium]|nr:nicotinamide mononucleotide transporter [Clostridia bacterium]
MKRILHYFSTVELCLWGFSVLAILISFFCFEQTGYLSLAGSLIGITSLILCAKGHPLGMALGIVFSVIYSIISYSFAYYGEMITYLGMTMPMSVLSLIAWLRHPHKESRAEVEVGEVGGKEYLFMGVLTVGITVGFYFILKAFGTANLIPSTISVATSFTAVYLGFRRSPYYALCYAANDIVLIVLWVLASLEDLSYLSVVICFAAFLANDIYAFINWRRMKKRQKEDVFSVSENT